MDNNEAVKALIKKHRLFQYEVAEVMGVSEGRLSTLLRRPLTEKAESDIKAAISGVLLRLEEQQTDRRDEILCA